MAGGGDMARRRKSGRQKQHTISCRDIHWEVARKQAKAEGMSISRFLVSRALTVELGKEEPHRPPRLVLAEVEQEEIRDRLAQIAERVAGHPGDGIFQEFNSRVKFISEAVVAQTAVSGHNDATPKASRIEAVPEMTDDRKQAVGGRSSIPKTAAGRARELAKVARHRDRLQRELAAARKQEAAIAAAVRADEKRVRAEIQQILGGMLLDHVEEWRAGAGEGDAMAQRKLDYWMGEIGRVITDPAGRELLGLPTAGVAVDAAKAGDGE